MTNKAVRATVTATNIVAKATPTPLQTAAASTIRVRASVSIIQSVAKLASSKAQALVQHVIPAAALHAVYITLAVELDPIGRNKFIYEMQTVADLAVLGVGKNFLETQTAVDEATYVLFKKGNLESLLTTETRRFAISKELADMVVATDDFYGSANIDDEQVMVFSKALSVEQQTVSDSSTTAFGKTTSDSVGSTDVKALDYSKGLTEPLATQETQAFDIYKQLADQVDAGDEFNAVALTDDGEVMVFGKTLHDDFTTADEAFVEAGKAAESFATAGDELLPFELGKGIEEPVATSEGMVFDTTKPLDDTFGYADAAAIGFSRPAFDQAYGTDGPNQYDTYAIAYFLEDYVREGFPTVDTVKARADMVAASDVFVRTMLFARSATDAFATTDLQSLSSSKALAEALSKADVTTVELGKARSDTVTKSDSMVRGIDKALNELVDATDDFQGALNSDDDQVMTFNKGVSDYPSTAELKTFGLAKPLADTATKSDVKVLELGKGRTDTVTKSDATTKSAGKSLNDLLNRSDTNTIQVGKSATDIALTSEQLVSSFGKGRTDSVTKSDAAAKEAGKALTDTFGKSDATVKTAGKGLTDNATTSESQAFAFSKRLDDAVITTDDFYGTANADDDETMAFTKVRGETVTQSDSSARLVAKGLTDTVSKSDVGSLVWTDYWDITYTDASSAVYVGNSQTF